MHMAEKLELMSLYSVGRRSSGCTSFSSDALVRCAVQLALSNRRYYSITTAVNENPKSRHIITAENASDFLHNNMKFDVV